MAENIKEHARHWRLQASLPQGGRVKRLKRGASIPIAVLVPKVALKKRLDVERLVASRIPAFPRNRETDSRAIEVKARIDQMASKTWSATARTSFFDHVRVRISELR